MSFAFSDRLDSINQGHWNNSKVLTLNFKNNDMRINYFYYKQVNVHACTAVYRLFLSKN